MTVFEYIRSPHDDDSDGRDLDGNDMVLAINKMQERGDWERFLLFCHINHYEHEINIYRSEILFDADSIANVIKDTKSFFNFMEEALKEGVIEK